MVSFTCSVCQDVVKKPKVAGHANLCRGAVFSCIDCMNVFDCQTVKNHSSCVSEAEKYQGKWRNKVVPTKTPTNRPHLRPPRPRMNLSSDSDDDGSWVWQNRERVALKSGSDSACQDGNASTSQGKRKRSRSMPQEMKNTTNCKGDACNAVVSPRDASASESDSIDCVVPSFALGTAKEVAQVAQWVIEDAGGAPLCLRALSKLMVERYNARIAKHVRQAIETVISCGKLCVQDGAVLLPQSVSSHDSK
ncbi:LYAR type C2HC zinc finger [Trypanosoma vivax]|nr:putative RNA binding protein [Trypanosoma vivax]KAH8619756.1 LYAR type C2HC zinc finger [Trypanosoma vivax]